MKTWMIPVAGAVGVLTGAFVGYVVTDRVMRDRYESLLDEEVERVKTFYKNLAGEKASATEVIMDEVVVTDEHISAFTLSENEKVLRKTNALIEELGYEEGLRQAEKDIPLFDDTIMSQTEYPIGKMTIEEATPIDYEGDAYAELIKNRSDDEPYIITIDEFMDECADHDKLSFNYFEGDDIVSDEREMPFMEVEQYLGSANIAHFDGKWSKNEDTVYIRNIRLKIDFEVTRDERSFGEVVAGFRPEPKEPIRKMRAEDD